MAKKIYLIRVSDVERWEHNTTTIVGIFTNKEVAIREAKAYFEDCGFVEGNYGAKFPTCYFGEYAHRYPYVTETWLMDNPGETLRDWRLLSQDFIWEPPEITRAKDQIAGRYE